MRSAVRPTKTYVEPAAFGWGAAVAAVLRHSTLPWREPLDAVPLVQLSPLGGRDRLSLVAQFAAHQALLQFAGVGDGACDAAEWAVVQRRGSDPRLVRLGARAGNDTPPALTLVQQFATAAGAPPLDALRQSWGRPEAVYCEIHQRLRHGAAADLRWMRAAAIGEIASPAPDGVRAILAARDVRLRYADDACIASLRLAHDRVLVLGETPSPLAPLRELAHGARNDAEIVERMVAAERLVVIVKDFERFDADARRVVELFAATGSGVLLLPGGQDLPESRPFLVSPRVVAGARSRAWLRDFAESPALDAFLEDGVLPPENSSLDALREPLRSLLGALSLLGRRIPRPLAARFLGQFLFGGSIDDLAVPGITHIENDALVFAADLTHLVPAASRESLCRVAADLLETTSDDDAVAAMHALPRRFLSPKLAEKLARALIRAGRYRDAREFATEPLLALIERRTGDYASALARLETIERDFDAELLRAELLYLEGRGDEALAALPAAQDDRVAYLRAIIANRFDEEIADPYLAARLAFYRTNAVDDALAALAAARTMAERIDAALDHLFALFTAGRWSEARAAALEALTMIDETQGDRAAGGILYLLAFLAADDGQCAHAAHLIERLEHFYGATRDERRLGELELLRAQLELSRGRFAAAARAANAIVATGASPQIDEAARLILDEIDAIEGRGSVSLRSSGTTANAELCDRYALLTGARPWGDFARALANWRNGGAVPVPSTGSETQKLFRFALILGRRDVAAALGIAAERDDDERADLRILRIAATADFPFAPHDFGALRWRFATRNRLGHWSEIGSLEPLDRAALDREAAEWMRCGEREFLYIDGADAWPAASRDAVAALFRVRSENYRLRRVIEQEESETRREPTVDGIVGDSPPMRDVFALIPRVARRDVAVCILGESGTGKELVARAIHRHSPRRAKTFTAVNCAALPETLIESELFGCVRGAFTGADRDRAGLIETTDGGTLFLDEVGELPLAAQAKLLRFLQDGELRRVGDAANRSADVRIVTATNRKLEAAVEQGRFREDLYYRIRGVEIVLPPLRERNGDVALLAAHFLANEREKHRGGPSSFAPDVEAAFAAHAWPGNVRELQNTIRAAHALAGDARVIELEHLPHRLREKPRRTAGAYHDEVARFRRELIERSLDEAGGNQNQAAAMLSMSRQALAYQIRELGILVKR